MTTAHRPTFDPARGKEALRGPAYHQRLQPAHLTLKLRKPGQGSVSETQKRDLRAELAIAEASVRAKHNADISGELTNGDRDSIKRKIDPNSSEPESTQPDAKRRLALLERAVEIDACESSDVAALTLYDHNQGKQPSTDKNCDDSVNVEEDDDDEDEDDDENDIDEDDDVDETAELLRELEKIKRERAEQRAREEAEKFAQDELKMNQIGRGNPLLNPHDFSIKRRWDDDVVFKNQARGTEERNRKKEFVNDLLRSDFHKRFINKYVR